MKMNFQNFGQKRANTLTFGFDLVTFDPFDPFCSSHFGTYTACLFCWAATSFPGVGARSALPQCVLSMLCNTTHINTISLTTLSLCSMVPSCTLKHLTKILKVFSATLLPWRSCSWLFFLPWSVVFCCRV